MTVNLSPLALPLTTRRLVIRDYAATDAPAVFAYTQDAAYWQFQSAEAPSATQIDTLLQWVVTQQSIQPRSMFFSRPRAKTPAKSSARVC